MFSYVVNNILSTFCLYRDKKKENRTNVTEDGDSIIIETLSRKNYVVNFNNNINN